MMHDFVTAHSSINVKFCASKSCIIDTLSLVSSVNTLKFKHTKKRIAISAIQRYKRGYIRKLLNSI